MLELGFSLQDRNELGEQPLHTAAYRGTADVVPLSIDAGADLDARDANFDGTPLGYATVGSGECVGQPGQWIETLRMLIEAGTSGDGVWISSKPPSEAVASVLREYGIRPNDDGEPAPDENDHVLPSIGTGVLADVAQHLETAVP